MIQVFSTCMWGLLPTSSVCLIMDLISDPGTHGISWGPDTRASLAPERQRSSLSFLTSFARSLTVQCSAAQRHLLCTVS